MKFAISGAGIAGLTTAVALKKYGFTAVVFEATETLMPVGAGLGLAQNALKALEVIGLADRVRAAGNALNYLTIGTREGKSLSTTTTRDFGESICIHRAALHQILMEETGRDNIITGKRALDVIKSDTDVTITFEDGTTYTADYLIIADGINSVLRNKIVPQSKVRYAGYTCWRAVVENPGLHLNGAVEVWDAKGRFGYVPLADNKVYWFACVNAPQGKQLNHFTLRHLQIIFEGYNDTVATLLAHTNPDVLIYDDIKDIQPIENYAYGNVVVIGDAAHAATPNMGQGACQAIEDAVVLAQCISKGNFVPDAFQAFEKKRLDRTHFIINQSRSIGRIAQLQQPFMIWLRNIALRWAPKSIQQKQFDKLNNIEFEV